MWFLVLFVFYIAGVFVIVRIYKKDRRPKVILIGFVVLNISVGLVRVLTMEIENGLLREEVKVELDNFRDPETLLIINSDTVRAEVELMIDQISKVGYFSAHHSSPGERVETVLVNKTKRFRFTFYRDSQIHNEYWLEYKDLDIGRFQSNCFDVLESQEYGK